MTIVMHFFFYEICCKTGIATSILPKPTTMEEDKLTTAFRRISMRLRQSARKLTGTADDADDVLQEAFFRLWRKRSEIHDEEHAEKLLTAIVHNVGIDLLRYRARYSDETPEEQAEQAPDEDRTELLSDITALIDRTLTGEQRQILYERDRDGWEIEDIALRHGLSEANVRMILSRSRKRVRELYQKRKARQI